MSQSVTLEAPCWRQAREEIGGRASGASGPGQVPQLSTVCLRSDPPTRSTCETPTAIPSPLQLSPHHALRPLFPRKSRRRPRARRRFPASTAPTQRASELLRGSRAPQTLPSCDLRRRHKPRSPCYRGDSPTPSPSPPLAHHAKQSNASRQSRRRPTGLSFAWPPTPRPASPTCGRGRGGRLLARWRDRPRRASQDAQHRGAGRESSGAGTRAALAGLGRRLRIGIA